MPQKTKGAPAVLADIETVLKQMTDAATTGHKYAIYNGPLAKEKLHTILDLLVELKRLVNEEVEPFMQRAAPRLEQRVAELEKAVAACADRNADLQRQIDDLREQSPRTHLRQVK